jgi:hypothetical protein
MERLVRVSRLHDLEASIVQHINQHHADKSFVLDNENERANVRFVSKHVEWNGDQSSSFLRPRLYSADANHRFNPRHHLLRYLNCVLALLERLRERDRDRQPGIAAHIDLSLDLLDERPNKAIPE